MEENKKKVMVFGVFDGIHEGHLAFLREAKQQGDYLIAVLAQDHIVEHLKGHQPKININERLEHLKQAEGVDEAVIGDAESETWEIVKKYQPDVIALGHDQKLLKDNLEKNLPEIGLNPELKVMKSYEANQYHSSILNE